MTTAAICRAALLVPFVLLVACRVESDPVAVKVQAMSFANSEWSVPVNLGPVVNSSSGEQNATLARDGLSLYFSSNRPGGAGNPRYLGLPARLHQSGRPCVRLGSA